MATVRLPPNLIHTRVEEVERRKGPPPWSETIILNEHIQANLICHAPGMTNRAHYHPEHDEFWVVLKGELVWELDGEAPIHARTGDVVLAPRGKTHLIRTVGSGPSLRLAIGVPDIPHYDPATRALMP